MTVNTVMALTDESAVVTALVLRDVGGGDSDRY